MPTIFVQSQTTKKEEFDLSGYYAVEISEYDRFDDDSCTCMAYISKRRRPCKHILFLRDLIEREKRKEDELEMYGLGRSD